jgi:tetraacyldisaccharide 4'-kinase
LVICDEDRIRGAKNAVALGAEVILLDDGFQHLRLKRDLNILLINSNEGIPPVLPFGNGRESASTIKYADIIIETGSGEKQSDVCAESIIGHISLYKSDGSYAESSVEIFREKNILVLSGIANPERFQRSLAPYALSILSIALKDHVEYNSAILEKIITKAKSENCEIIATTTKDAVKMLDLYKAMQQNDILLPQLAVVYSEIEFMKGKEIIFDRIQQLFKTQNS